MVVAPIAVGKIIDYTIEDGSFGYFWCGIFFIVELGISFVILLLLL